MSNSVLLVHIQDVLIKESGLNGLYIGEGVKGVWPCVRQLKDKDKDKDKGVNDPLTKVSSELLIILCWVFFICFSECLLRHFCIEMNDLLVHS